MAYATVEDLAERWRPLSADEEARATTLLADASGEIDAEFRRSGRTVADALADESVTEDDLRVVACRIVQRAMTSPLDVSGEPVAMGVKSTQVGVGPFQESRQYANPMGDLYLTKQDRRRLGLGGQVAFTTPPPESSVVHAPYCALLWDGVTCTCGALA